MELRQLRYFLAVADELHFRRAAERLLIASPSLSQQIKTLERELRVQLFERSSTGVRLTPNGARLVPLARDAVTAADLVTATAQQLAGGRNVQLRIGFLAFAWTAAARELVGAFGRLHPEVDIRLRQYEWNDPSAGLAGDEVDIAIVRPPFTGADRLRTVEIHREKLLAVLRDGDPLSRSTSVALADLVGQPILETTLVRDPVFAAYWYLRDIRRVPAVLSRSTTVEEWLAEVGLGRGVNLIPASFAAEYSKPGLAFVPVDGLPATRVVLAWKPGSQHHAAHLLAQLASRQP